MPDPQKIILTPDPTSQNFFRYDRIKIHNVDFDPVKQSCGFHMTASYFAEISYYFKETSFDRLHVEQELGC